MIGISGGNQRKHSVSSKRMSKMSSLSIATMIGLIITTIVALSCLNAYRKLSAPISHTSTLTAQPMKVVDTDKPLIQLKSLTDSELLIDSKSNKEKEQEKEKERDKYKEKEQEKDKEKKSNQDKNDKMKTIKFKEEEISDENMELIEIETKKTKTNLRQGVQKDFLKNEDRKIYPELNLFHLFIFCMWIYLSFTTTFIFRLNCVCIDKSICICIRKYFALIDLQKIFYVFIVNHFPFIYLSIYLLIYQSIYSFIYLLTSTYLFKTLTPALTEEEANNIMRSKPYNVTFDIKADDITVTSYFNFNLRSHNWVCLSVA